MGNIDFDAIERCKKRVELYREKEAAMRREEEKKEFKLFLLKFLSVIVLIIVGIYTIGKALNPNTIYAKPLSCSINLKYTNYAVFEYCEFDWEDGMTYCDTEKEQMADTIFAYSVNGELKSTNFDTQQKGHYFTPSLLNYDEEYSTIPDFKRFQRDWYSSFNAEFVDFDNQHIVYNYQSSSNAESEYNKCMAAKNNDIVVGLNRFNESLSINSIQYLSF